MIAYEYFLLFSSAFLAATLLPFYSELALVALLVAGEPLLPVVGIATLGNTLGSCVNWCLGRYLLKFQHKRWFPFKEKQLGRAQKWFDRFGKWCLLLAWMPLGGDALTFIAGIMRVNLIWFIVLTAIGKGLRYLFIGLLI